MIRDYQDLEHCMKQLGRVMAALIDLHKQIGHNSRNYALYSEADVDMVLELRGEIDAFLGIKPPPADAAPAANGATPEAAAHPEPAASRPEAG